MKKILFAISALLLALLCLVGCVNSNSLLGTINTALHAQYSNVTVNIGTVQNGVSLGGTFELSFDGDTVRLHYSYDKLSELSLEGGNPQGNITRVEGDAQIVNGVLTDGEPENLNAGQLDYTGFSFKQGFLSNVQSSDKSLSASVANPKGFVGNTQFDGTDMSVNVTLDGTRLTELVVDYTSAKGAAVSITYIFTA